MFRTLCLASALCFAVSCTNAAHWPQFRGPSGEGHSSVKKLPLTWGEDSDNIKWKVPIDGLGWSSPVVADERVWLTTATGGGASLRAVCLDLETGDVIHNVEVFAKDEPGAIHAKNSHATPTPIVECDRVYVHFGTYGTACVSTSGEVLWSQRMEYKHKHGPGSSPVLVEDVLIFSCDGEQDPFVVALDKWTGWVRWKTPRPEAPGKQTFAFSTPLVVELDGRTEVVIPGANSVCSYEPASGREIWHVKYSGGFSTVPRPVHGHGLVYVSTGYGSTHLLAIRCGGEGDVTETNVVWRARRGVPLNPSPLLVGDELYVVSDNGVATCLDARTGEAHYRKRVSGNYSASPLHAAGRIYIVNETGLTTVFRPGPQFEQLATNQVEGRTLASLTPVDGALLLRTDTHLYRIEAE